MGTIVKVTHLNVLFDLRYTALCPPCIFNVRILLNFGHFGQGELSEIKVRPKF